MQVELMNWLFHKITHHCVWYCWVTTTKTVSLFSGEDYSLASSTLFTSLFLFFVHYPWKHQVIHLIKLNLKRLQAAWQFVWHSSVGVFHVFQIVQMVPNCATHHNYPDSDEPSSSATILLLSNYVLVNFFFWTPFPFL